MAEKSQDESRSEKQPVAEERKLIARRALVQAGWTAPIIAGVTMLAEPASAVTIHGDSWYSYTDYNHPDHIHTDFTKWEHWD